MGRKLMNFSKGFAVIMIFLCPTFLIANTFIKQRILVLLSITSGFFAYHIYFRHLVAIILGKVVHNDIDFKAAWFREKKCEKYIFKLFRVKKWKDKLPIANEDEFDTSKCSLVDLAGATAQAEMDHEINIVFSLLPLLLIGVIESTTLVVFFSILGTIIEIPFILIQRYNRPRLVKLIDKGYVLENNRLTQYHC